MLKREIMQRKNIYDSAVEISAVSDIVLPENMGDIERILKCSFTPRLMSKNVEANRLSLQGSGILRMVYKTDDGNLESFETQIPFSKNIDVASGTDNLSVFATLSTEFCSCRAVSPRRFEMNAGIKANVKAWAICRLDICDGAEEENVELKRVRTEAVVPVFCACENFTVMEDYELSKGTVKTILKATATPSVLEHKIISGKIILKGNVDFCAVYTTDEDTAPVRVNYNIPVNHIISAPGTEESDDVRLALSICRMSVESVARGGNGEITVEILLEACADVSRKETVTAATDAYCVGFESRCSHQNIALTTLEKTVEKNHTVNLSIDTDGSEIIDTFADIKNVSLRVNEQGEIMTTADALVSALCKNENGDFFINEKSSPIEFSVAAASEFAFSDLEGEMTLASVNSSKNGVSLNLNAKCTATKKQSIPMVCEVEIMTDSPKKVNPKTALTIYFASKGEDTFDIAKRYNTSNKEIMLHNSLSDTLIPDDMTILIPMTR